MVNNLILSKAQNAVTAHDWETAARLYKELLRKDESNIEFLKELGNIYVKANQDEKAIPYFEQIITFQSDATFAMISLGSIYRRLKRYEDSIQILQRALDEGHDSSEVNYALGFTYKDMGNHQDAIDAFQSVISEKPDDVLAYNHLGSIYYLENNYDKSIAAFTRGLQVDPNHPILNYNLARCYDAAKKYPDAVRCYENALKTRPGWTDAIRDFSEVLIKCQFTKQAQNLVEQSINLHPNDVDLLCILGRIYLSQFDYDNATKTFTKAKNLKEGDISILLGLSEALEKNEKLSQSLETIIEALDISPDNKEVRKRYIHTLLSSQRYEKALEVLKVLDQDTDGTDLQVMDLYGQYFICRGNDEAANTYFEKIKRINHHYKDYMLNAADRYIQTGNLEKAESFANDFVDCRGQLPDGYNRLGNIYCAKGDLDTAILQFEKGKEVSNSNVLAAKEIAKIKNLQIQKVNAPVEEVQIENEEPENKVDELNEYLEDIVVEPLAQSDEETFDYSQIGFKIPQETEEEEEDFWSNVDGMNNPSNPLIDEESDTDLIFADYKKQENTVEQVVEKPTEILVEEPEEKLAGEPEKPAEETLDMKEDDEFDESFADLDDLMDQYEEPFDESEILAEELSLEGEPESVVKVVVEKVPETVNEPVSFDNPTAMLNKIGKILNDNDLAAEYSQELELFKTLSVLSNFLPESEKNSFNSCKMRMKIEYIISKMSGKPGLLETVESLIKSEVLGKEYLDRLEYDRNNLEVTNDMIVAVIHTMKKLSEFLDDKNITNALSVSADGILEQIELENQKSAIF